MNKKTNSTPFARDAAPMRDYQHAALVAVRKSLAARHHTILKVATGCGKAPVANEMIRAATSKGNRT